MALVLSPRLPSFFSSPLCCFLGTDFNSPSDQSGIHKPLSTPFRKHYLGGMMKHFKGWWLQQHIIFCCGTWQWVLPPHTNRVTNASWRNTGNRFFLCAFIQSPTLQTGTAPSLRTDRQLFLQIWTERLNGIWFCSSFISAVNFLGDRPLSIMDFWGEPDPKRVCPRHGWAAPTYRSRELRVWCAKNTEENTRRFFFTQHHNQIFAYVMTGLFLPRRKWPTNTNCLGSDENTSFPSGWFPREINLTQPPCLSDLPPHDLRAWEPVSTPFEITAEISKDDSVPLGFIKEKGLGREEVVTPMRKRLNAVRGGRTGCGR